MQTQSYIHSLTSAFKKITNTDKYRHKETNNIYEKLNSVLDIIYWLVYRMRFNWYNILLQCLLQQSETNPVPLWTGYLGMLNSAYTTKRPFFVFVRCLFQRLQLYLCSFFRTLRIRNKFIMYLFQYNGCLIQRLKLATWSSMGENFYHICISSMIFAFITDLVSVIGCLFQRPTLKLWS